MSRATKNVDMERIWMMRKGATIRRMDSQNERKTAPRVKSRQ